MSAESRATDQVFDLVIASVHGRGNWVATQLATLGWKVALVDITQKFDRTVAGGPVQPEDVEGPFGLLESSDCLPSQRARLFDEEESEVVPQGFNLWLDEGPIEFKSELTSFQLRARGVPEELENYLRRAAPKSRETERERSKLTTWAYGRNWLAHFAHSFASARYLENHVAIETGSVASPLFSGFSIRRLTREGEAKGLKNCSSAGVRVIDGETQIENVKFGPKAVEAFEISGRGDRGTVAGKSFLWCLSQAETLAMFEERIATQLFPQTVVHPTWSWERFRFDVTAGQDGFKALPSWSCLIGDRDLAWTRANMVVLRPVFKSNQKSFAALDAWVKCPAWMRHPKERAALENVVRETKSLILSRMPLLKISDPSLEHRAPLFWPVFELGPKIKTYSGSNLFVDAPDQWETLDWLGRFRHQSQIVPKLEKLKERWEAIERKEAQKAARRSPSP